MSFCDKCGAYVPIGDTACPACGYDPEAEAKKAREAEERAAAEERRRAAERVRLEHEEAERREREAAERKAREEAERRYAEQQKRWQRDPWQQTPAGTSAQGQYTARQASGAYAAQYAPQSAGAKSGEYREEKHSPYDEEMRRRASESADRQKLSVLSYLGPFWLIPMIVQNKDDEFMHFHTEQGLGLLIFNVLTQLVGRAFGWIGTVGTIICVIAAIKGIMNVLSGKRAPIPVIGDVIRAVKEKIAKR